MNIFDMIFKNSLTKEVIFSSVYNYLMDPRETHGMKDLLLKDVLKSIEKESSDRRLLLVNSSSVDSAEPEYRFGQKRGGETGSDNDEDKKKAGFIDSLIVLKDSDTHKQLRLYTEVKIIDASAKNENDEGAQLCRYINAIKDENSGEEDSWILIYMIRSRRSKKCLKVFKQMLDTLSNKEDRERCFVFFWRSESRNDDRDRSTLEKLETEGRVLSDSLESILRSILSRDLCGDIPPLSTEIRYVLKSLVNIIFNDFKRPSGPRDSERFPDQENFLSRIPEEHRDLYQYLIERVYGSVAVRPSNTSIGFPFARKQGGKYNTLFRVLTMKNFKMTEEEIIYEDYADCLIIEVEKPIYEHSKAEFRRIFDGIADIHEDKIHPNEYQIKEGAGRLEVVWFELKKNKFQPDVNLAKKRLEDFVQQAKKAFADIHRQSGHAKGEWKKE